MNDGKCVRQIRIFGFHTVEVDCAASGDTGVLVVAVFRRLVAFGRYFIQQTFNLCLERLGCIVSMADGVASVK